MQIFFIILLVIEVALLAYNVYNATKWDALDKMIMPETWNRGIRFLRWCMVSIVATIGAIVYFS